MNRILLFVVVAFALVASVCGQGWGLRRQQQQQPRQSVPQNVRAAEDRIVARAGARGGVRPNMGNQRNRNGNTYRGTTCRQYVAILRDLQSKGVSGDDENFVRTYRECVPLCASDGLDGNKACSGMLLF